MGRMSREERMRKELTYDDAIALSIYRLLSCQFPFSISQTTFLVESYWCQAGARLAQVAPTGHTCRNLKTAGTQVIAEGRFLLRREERYKAGSLRGRLKSR